MRVQAILTEKGNKRYILLDADGSIIIPVAKYLKYKDNVGAARNTLRTYCYHLKLFYEYLHAEHLEYWDMDIDRMAAFVRWLSVPYVEKVEVIYPIEAARTSRSINQIISAVINYYDYLSRHIESELQLSKQLMRQISASSKGFRSFLHHASRQKFMNAKLIKLKEPKYKPKTLSKDKIISLQNACCNKRDVFLIQLLWESSMRIGEALALWLEDFEVDSGKVHVRDRGELVNGAEIKTVCSPRAIDVSADLINDYMGYIAYFHDDDVDTNHVFIKLSGVNRNQPMEYQDVVSLFERLKAKVGFEATPHMLRHSSLTELRRSGWKPEHLMKRAGHAHVQTTMQMYIHPSDEDLRKDWEIAESNMKLINGEEDK